MDPFTLMALVAISGYSMYQADQQKQQTNESLLNGKLDVAKGQSDLLASQYKKRRTEGADAQMVQGYQGSDASQAIADQGTMLTSTPKTRSLLGG